ncbi:Lon protease 1 [Andreesenia angusta]|uniref:Lon protease n=1 Tax=Andreesenia angusta TaxID=39480 RepID=A0A1S1V5I1_9FIRM|nr:endopeptidase La [Andreesenia angusta]OHW61842.1 Lon protease 1 [Andreesenia angusta]
MDNRDLKVLPYIPLRGLSVFPHMVLHFDVGRDKSIEALEAAMAEDSIIFLSSQKSAETENPGQDDFYHIGTICKIKQMLKLPGDVVRVLVEGINRGEIVNFIEDEKDYLQVEIKDHAESEKVKKTFEMEALMRMIMDSFEEYIHSGSKISPEVLLNLSDIKEPGRFADTIASYLPVAIDEKQLIIDKIEPKDRLELIQDILEKELEIIKIEERISRRVKKQINKVQKEYYLREQVKAIQKELGEGEMEETDEIRGYRAKMDEMELPEEVVEKLNKELDKLARMSSSSAESGVVRNYVEWILDLPWDKETEDSIDIKKSRVILDEDHYGLKDVKERILEYLAVRKLTDSLKGPILCLVGPPGVGKTSIAKSVARAINREFVRMSLGGVRDEAEIRGHRRTYVGSIPGRIISSMKKVGQKNPVFLLDEIDKLSGDFRGDPASALLEVLDPEQNSTFTDHYLELPFDLSKVMFITTANSLNTIPGPLLDRMEIIRIAGYTEDEKLSIAKKYLLPKQMKEHGLGKSKLQISENTLREIVKSYTREAGVRNLEREIANICRKAGKKIVEDRVKTVRINSGNLKNYLGNAKYRFDSVEEQNQVGLVRGLAWTAVGGDTLSIEVNIMHGTGKVQLTGKLGDVMKESAMTGISYIRSRADELKVDPNFYKEKDVHIHVPEGAIPKDGPSAGITMATAVISALTDTKVDRQVAMTGEITLRGMVLPVGGIKEKVLAAYRAGVKKIILPWDNKRDMEEVSEKVKKEIEFVFVKNISEVLPHVLIVEDKEDSYEN